MKQIAWILIILLTVTTVLFAVDALTIQPDGTIMVRVHGRERSLDSALPPVGSIQAYALSAAPEGWLICNGDLIDKSINTDHAMLVDLLRAEAGSNTNHPYYHPDPDKAYLPDLLGRFARGLDTTAAQDRDPGATLPASNIDDRRLGRDGATEVGAVLGSVQEDAFQGHWHAQSPLAMYISGSGGEVAGSYGGYRRNVSTNVRDPISDGTGITPRTSTETRPANVAVNYLIKY